MADSRSPTDISCGWRIGSNCICYFDWRIWCNKLSYSQKQRNSASHNLASTLTTRRRTAHSGIRALRHYCCHQHDCNIFDRHVATRQKGKVMLALTDITLNYEGRTILDNASLSVARGEIVSLVGPSGSGKTTLLRVIAGLEQPSQGTVVIDNKLMTGIPTHKRDVGLVFQDNQLFPHLCVFDNIAYSLRVKRVSKALQIEKVNEMLSLIGMEDLARRDVGQLSGGEAKRIAVARALVADPFILLLDEPLTGLDAELRDRLLEDMGALLRARRTTVVHVTHDHNEATRLSDRVVDVRTLGQSGVQLQ